VILCANRGAANRLRRPPHPKQQRTPIQLRRPFRTAEGANRIHLFRGSGKQAEPIHRLELKSFLSLSLTRAAESTSSFESDPHIVDSHDLRPLALVGKRERNVADVDGSEGLDGCEEVCGGHDAVVHPGRPSCQPACEGPQTLAVSTATEMKEGVIGDLR